jgi:hypothetical protein
VQFFPSVVPADLFATGPAASARCFSLPYSRRRAFAGGEIPCSRASRAAAAHKGSGIGKRPVCALLQFYYSSLLADSATLGVIGGPNDCGRENRRKAHGRDGTAWLAEIALPGGRLDDRDF